MLIYKTVWQLAVRNKNKGRNLGQKGRLGHWGTKRGRWDGVTGRHERQRGRKGTKEGQAEAPCHRLLWCAEGQTILVSISVSEVVWNLVSFLGRPAVGLGLSLGRRGDDWSLMLQTQGNTVSTVVSVEKLVKSLRPPVEAEMILASNLN